MEPLPSSFRDPSGFIFQQNGEIFRQVNPCYGKHYDLLMSSGLYESLVQSGYLISHEELDAKENGAYKIIKPVKIPFVSYPYEWCFGQLKKAALTTLRIHQKALEKKMILKDASAYNIQFTGYKAVFIDTLSFEEYEEDKPWVAYKQFCQHFLAPLALISLTDSRLGNLLQINIDGVPLDLTAKLLPVKAKLNPSLLMHVFAHAKAQENASENVEQKMQSKLPYKKHLDIITNLIDTVLGLKLKKQTTTWSDYYSDTNYSDRALKSKESIIKTWIGDVRPSTTWDVGANTGHFSRIATALGSYVVSMDMDEECVQENFVQATKERNDKLLPIRLDLAQPSPAIGWFNSERSNIIDRGPSDLSLALALVHHLAIGNNVPFDKIAQLFATTSKNLIIEFVPKEDSQVMRLLATREDVFPNYNQSEFEREFEKWFKIDKKETVEDSHRVLYLMSKNHI